MTDKEKLIAIIVFLQSAIPYQLGGYIAKSMDALISADDRLRCEREVFKKASWIGQHIQRCFMVGKND